MGGQILEGCGGTKVGETLSGVNYFFGLTTTISPYRIDDNYFSLPEF
jgi:hypothetical protein